MLFLWVSLKTGSCCKTWPFLVLLTKKEDPEEDPCGGWSLGDLPFHQGLPTDVPRKVNLPSMDCKVIICMAYSRVCSHEGGCIRLCCQSIGKIACLENQSQDSNKSCDNASALTLEQDLGRMRGHNTTL